MVSFRLIGALLMGCCMIAETQLLISWLLLLMWWNFSVIQSGNFQYKSVFQGLRSIWQTEGSKGMCVLVEIFYNSFNAPLSLPPTSPFTTQVYTVGCCQLWCGMLPSLVFMFCSTHNPSGLSWEVRIWISISAVKRMLDDAILGSTMSCQPILLLGNIEKNYSLCPL